MAGRGMYARGVGCPVQGSPRLLLHDGLGRSIFFDLHAILPGPPPLVRYSGGGRTPTPLKAVGIFWRSKHENFALEMLKSRGCWHFEDKLPLEIQLSWLLGAVRGPSWGPKSVQVGSQKAQVPVGSRFLRFGKLSQILERC